MDTSLSPGPVACHTDGQCVLALDPPCAGHCAVNQDVWLVECDGQRTVYVHGVVLAQYDVNDPTERNVVMWLLAKGKYTKQTELAAAFGLTTRQVNRLCTTAAHQGVGALLRKERSDKTPQSVALRVCRLRDEGRKISTIAQQVGVSSRTVYSILQERGYDPHDRPAPSQLGLPVDDECAQVDDQAAEAQPQDPAENLAQAQEDILGDDLDKPEADVEFHDAQGVYGAGVLLAVAAEGGVLLQEGRNVYGRLRRGVYGLRAFVLGLFVMALLSVKNSESLKAKDPDALGRLLGLPRIFEVKTLRRKLKEIGARHKAMDWYHAMARRWVGAAADELATLYVDGHTRAYYGKRPIAKGWCARRRLCQPATTDTWTNDSLGQPLLRITHEAHPSLAQVLPQVLDDVRQLVGPPRITVAFDRGGWSGATFKKLVAEGFDFVTYRPGHHDLLPEDAFSDYTMPHGHRTEVMKLADTHLSLSGYGPARLIVIQCPDGKQTHVVASNRDAPAVDVVLQLLARWQQENFFKYMRQNYNIDAVVDYGTEPVEDREVPNPEHKALTKELRQARAQLRKLQAQAHGASTDARRTAAEGHVQRCIAAQSQRIDSLLRQRKAIPPRCMLSQTDRADEVKLSVDRKLCSDLVKVAAYRTESLLVRRIEGVFARNADEGHAFIRAAMQQTGTIRVDGWDVHVTLEPMSAPRFTRALQALCTAINSDDPVYPETKWRLHFDVRHIEDRHPNGTACQEF